MLKNTPLTIKETQKGLVKKDFSAVELVDSYIKKIDENKDLNAYITVCEDEAYKKAKEIDSVIKDSPENLLSKYPMLGVAIGHKDLFLTKGIRTTAASKVLETYIPPYSATIVRKIDNAGGIILGKTNCDAWAHGASGENSDFGPSKNPWNKQYVPGGSSSGSAISVAAGLSLAATGTDTGGSIRQPANFCGIIGLKPTYGAVSRYGVIAMASSLDTVGFFANQVEDVEKIFSTVRGPDGYDATLPNRETKPQESSVSRLKIGIPKEYFTEGLDKEVEKEVYKAIDIFKKQGVDIVEVSIPHTKYAIDVYYIIQPAEVSSNLGRYDGIRFGYDRSKFGSEAVRRIMLGTYVLSAGYYDAYYLKAQKVRTLLIKEFEKVFREVDALITPVSPTPAFELGEKSSDPLKMYLSDIFTVSANIVGIPALALPYGFTKKGLPLGFQLMGNRFSEKVLFDLGKIFHKAVDFRPQAAI